MWNLGRARLCFVACVTASDQQHGVIRRLCRSSFVTDFPSLSIHKSGLYRYSRDVQTSRRCPGRCYRPPKEAISPTQTHVTGTVRDSLLLLHARFQFLNLEKSLPVEVGSFTPVETILAPFQDLEVDLSRCCTTCCTTILQHSWCLLATKTARNTVLAKLAQSTAAGSFSL